MVDNEIRAVGKYDFSLKQTFYLFCKTKLLMQTLIRAVWFKGRKDNDERYVAGKSRRAYAADRLRWSSPLETILT